MRRTILASLAVLTLAGCATPTVYGPAATPTAVGYSDYRIEPGRYRITFQGGAGAPAAQISDYALLRASEITLRDGYDWFRITDRMGWRDPGRSGPQVSIGGGSASFGRGGGVGFGLGTSFDLSGGPAVTRSMEIVTGKGPPPSGVDAYDARAVSREIGPRAHS